MSLENLAKINQLQHHTTNTEEIGRLLAAAIRNLADARFDGISDESRFDIASASAVAGGPHPIMAREEPA